MVVWWLSVSIAIEPIRSQVPVPASASGEPIEYCSTFYRARRGKQREKVESRDGKVGLRCEQVSRRDLQVCLLLDPSHWPSRFPEELSCRVGERDIYVYPYVAWDPTWELGEPMVRTTTRHTHGTVTYRIPSTWTRASSGSEHLSCSVAAPGRLQLEVEPGMRFGAHECTLHDADGAQYVIPITLQEALLPANTDNP